jgi:hypothetical protein
MDYQREMMPVDVFIKFLDEIIAGRNKNERPPSSPLQTGGPSYGLCGKFGITAAYRMREFIAQTPSILCYLCNAAIDGALLVDFYLYVGPNGSPEGMLPREMSGDLHGIVRDLNATYLLLFTCKKCWNKTVAHHNELTSYAEHAFLSKTKYARKAEVTGAVISSKGDVCQNELMDGADRGTMEIERPDHSQLIQVVIQKEDLK